MRAISVSGELGLLPHPLAGEGGGGGEIAQIILFACPSYPSPASGGGDRTECAASLRLSTSGHALQLVRGAAIALEIGVFEEAARLFETFLICQYVAFIRMLLVGKLKRHGVELLAA